MGVDQQHMNLPNEDSIELASILDLDRLLDRAAEIIRSIADYDLLAVLLIEGDRPEFVCRTALGLSEESRLDLQRLKVHEGLAGRAVRTRSPVLVSDVRAEADYRPVRTAAGQDPRAELVLPLIAKEKVIGVLILWSVREGFFGENHLQLLMPLAAQIAVSAITASLYEEKSRNALARQVLNEVAKDMTAILELDELLGRMAILIRRVIEYEILGIFLYNPEVDVMELKVAIGYSKETIKRWSILPMGRGLLGHAVLARKTLVSSDLAHDPRAISAETIDGRWTQAEVAIPLISRRRLLGGLVVESCDPHYFIPEHIEILDTLARQMAVAIDNAQLFQQLTAKEHKLEADFALAKDLQASMLPVSMPNYPGYQFSSMYRPAESLGGDYYDFLFLSEDQLALVIGDVSGKGVAAAMTMAAARSALRFAVRFNSAPSQVLYHINRRLFRDLKKRNYVSLFYGVLDLKARMLRWSNAGHLPPILVRADESVEELAKGGFPVAMFDKSRYAGGQVRLAPGDVIFSYTDGLTELLNKNGEEFGRDRLIGILRNNAQLPAKEILRAVNGEVRKFGRGMKPQDDLTIFVVKVCE